MKDTIMFLMENSKLRRRQHTKVISYLGITAFKELDYRENGLYTPANGERKYIRKHNDGKLLRN